YRQYLRRTEKARYKNNLRGSRLALLTNWRARLRLKAAKTGRDHLKVLEHGEEVLLRTPWDLGTQIAMSDAAEALGLLDLAIWSLEQARQAAPNHVSLNRTLARLYEKRGNFAPAIALWELVRRADPTDLEAQHKAKDLAASDTIARGHFEEALADEAAPHERAAGPGRAGAKPRHAPALPARVARAAAPARKRREAHPAVPPNYLQPASLCRRDRLIAQAQAVLEQGLGPTGNNFHLSIEL